MFNKAKDKANEVMGSTQEQYGKLTDDDEHQAKGVARKLIAQGRQAVSEATDVVRNRIEVNPIKAIAITAGFGLLVFLLIRNK